MQHRVAIRKNCSWAIWRTDLFKPNENIPIIGEDWRRLYSIFTHHPETDWIYSQLDLLAVAVQKQVYDKSLPSLLLTECVQCCGCEGKA